MRYRLFIFLLLNFLALAIGSMFTSIGVPSEWYIGLNKAPWTPPGWFFGIAWSTIMICFSIYLSYLWPLIKNKKQLIGLFSAQWFLNTGWNPCFFYYQNAIVGMVIITCLTLLIVFFTLKYYSELKTKSLLICPYLIWLLIATSLNGYILLYN